MSSGLAVVAELVGEGVDARPFVGDGDALDCRTAGSGDYLAADGEGLLLLRAGIQTHGRYCSQQADVWYAEVSKSMFAKGMAIP